jgi:hypothetical protein
MSTFQVLEVEVISNNNFHPFFQACAAHPLGDVPGATTAPGNICYHAVFEAACGGLGYVHLML